MSYNYNNEHLSESETSFNEKFVNYANNFNDGKYIERKRVKILTKDNTDLSFEDFINSYIKVNEYKMKIYDIKFYRSQIMIIYEPIEIVKTK